MKQAFLLFMAIALSACAGIQSRNDSKAGQGYRLYASKCSACHALVKPAKLTSGKWAELLEKHSDRVNLAADEKDVILNFLAENSAK